MASTTTAAAAANDTTATAPSTGTAPNDKKRVQWAADVIDNESKNSAKTYMKSHLGSNNNSDGKATKKKKICRFCGRNPAAVVVKGRGPNKKKQALCLLHYYTTSAVHVDEEGSEFVDILDPTLVQEQLNGKMSSENNNGDSQTTTTNVQELFAEAFVQLQQELAQESLSIPVVQPERKKNPRQAPPENDPLGMLHDLGRSKKRQRKPPPPVPTNNNIGGGGGFLKPIPVPERLRKTQQQQAQIQAELVARMNRVAKTGSAAAAGNNKREDMSRRRQPTKKSVWNVVMDEKINSKKATNREKSNKNKNQKPNMSQVLNNTYHAEDTRVNDVTCTCGSNNVSSVGNVTSRNQDVRKGEIWGSGANDDVVLQYRCNQCGKAWSETG